MKQTTHKAAERRKKYLGAKPTHQLPKWASMGEIEPLPFVCFCESMTGSCKPHHRPYRASLSKNFKPEFTNNKRASTRSPCDITGGLRFLSLPCTAPKGWSVWVIMIRRCKHYDPQSPGRPLSTVVCSTAVVQHVVLLMVRRGALSVESSMAKSKQTGVSKPGEGRTSISRPDDGLGKRRP